MSIEANPIFRNKRLSQRNETVKHFRIYTVKHKNKKTRKQEKIKNTLVYKCCLCCLITLLSCQIRTSYQFLRDKEHK